LTPSVPVLSPFVLKRPSLNDPVLSPSEEKPATNEIWRVQRCPFHRIDGYNLAHQLVRQ